MIIWETQIFIITNTDTITKTHKCLELQKNLELRSFKSALIKLVIRRIKLVVIMSIHEHFSQIFRLTNTNTKTALVKRIRLLASPLVVEMPMREHLSPPNHRRRLHLLIIWRLIIRENTSSSNWLVMPGQLACQCLSAQDRTSYLFPPSLL